MASTDVAVVPGKETEVETAPASEERMGADATATPAEKQEVDAGAVPDDSKDVVVASPGKKAPKTSAGSKRKSTLTVEAVSARIKRLQDDADRDEAAARELDAAAEAKRGEAAAKRGEAAAKRADARKVSESYAKMFREAALAKVEASMRKKPSNAYCYYSTEMIPTVQAANLHERAKKVAQMWANLPAEQKQKYFDKLEEEKKKYLDWASSEEGKQILREREEILRQCKSDSAEALTKAAATLESPVKQRRVAAPAKAIPAKVALAAEPALDEEVLQAAEKLNLRAQLCNLAGRPEVVALKKSSLDLLKALQANNGMVNAAKRSLEAGQ